VPTADRQTATVLVRIGFDELDPRILPDMGVRVTFLREEGEGVANSQSVALVPRTAVRTAAGQSFVINSNVSGVCTGAFDAIYPVTPDLYTEVPFGFGNERFILTDTDDGSLALEEVVIAWPRLPEHIRLAIGTLGRSARSRLSRLRHRSAERPGQLPRRRPARVHGRVRLPRPTLGRGRCRAEHPQGRE